MIKLLAMDLDETLLGSDKHVSPANKKALQKARQNGIHTVIATGRPWFSFVHTLEEIETKDLEGEYSITLNGGALAANNDGKVLSCQGLDYSTISMLFKKGLEYDVCIHINTVDKAYGWNLDDEEREFLKGRLEIIELEEPDLSAIEGEQFIKILFGRPDTEYLHSILKDMEDVAGDFDVTFSSDRYLEFNKKGVSKGLGLQQLARLYGIDLSQTAAIGDNANDLSMIQAAGIGIAPANAIDSVKEAAQYVTEGDHNRDAIAQAIDYLLEINQKETCRQLKNPFRSGF